MTKWGWRPVAGSQLPTIWIGHDGEWHWAIDPKDEGVIGVTLLEKHFAEWGWEKVPLNTDSGEPESVPGSASGQ